MQIEKTLSANDIGATGGHQAGILVPKAEQILAFFPHLPSEKKNPRAPFVVHEKASGERWDFQFIYYNNKLFRGTRNEFRLTGMTRFLRAIGALPGDKLVFTKDQTGRAYVALERRGSRVRETAESDVLILRSGWVYIKR